MPKIYLIVCLLGCVKMSSLQFQGSGDNGNLRVCVVEGRGSNKRAGRYCPQLDEQAAPVECVLGTDRLDCLRRMSKGTVDFGVFSPEDLVAAEWTAVDVLVAAEIRSRPRPFERSIVAVVSRRVLPRGVSPGLPAAAVLLNSTLCHQGHGGDDSRILSDTLSEYLESLVTPRQCNASLSPAEDRLRALAGYFARGCVPGHWLPDTARDTELKAKYPSLCAACSSGECVSGDRYWGVTGALACLADGAGDVVWAHLDDVEAFFGLSGTAGYSGPEQFAFLCRDGTWQQLASSTNSSSTSSTPPCSWLSVPWPVLVAKRKAAESVGALASQLTVEAPWRGALSALLQVNGPPHALHPPVPPLDYLSAAHGFREAYSRTGCSPTRHVTLCTTSPLESAKCEWLAEAARVCGVAPPLQCARRQATDDCLAAIDKGECDVTLADSDWLVRAQRDYSVTPLLHETTPIIEQASTVVAYVKKSAKLAALRELRGKRAAFPRFDGLAWHAVAQYLAESEGRPCSRVLAEYFGEICAPGGGEGARDCGVGDGELGALRSLLEDKSDVAFFSLGTFHRYSEGKLSHEPWAKETELVPLCPEGNEMYCFLSWASVGHVYAGRGLSAVRRQEIITLFEQADQLFGRKPPFRTAMFSLYSPFNHQPDVLFHNSTKSLATAAVLFTHPYDKIPRSFERSLTADSCQLAVPGAAAGVSAAVGWAVSCLVLVVLS